MTYLPPSKTGLGWSFMLPSFSKASRICVSLVTRLFRSPQKLRGREGNNYLKMSYISYIISLYLYYSYTMNWKCGTCSSHLSTRSHVKHPWPSPAASHHSHSPTCIFNWGWARVQYVSQNFGAVQAVPSPSSRLGAATPAQDSPSSAACFLHTERCEMRRESWTGHEAFGESSEAKLGVLKWLRMHCNNIPWASFPANQTVDHVNTCFPQL